MSRPRRCGGCGIKPVADKRRRFCPDCEPGGPYTPPPCRRCGSTEDYFSAGLCARCHQYAPQQVGSCRDCHAWGVTRTHQWLCFACTTWRCRHPRIAACLVCGRELAVSERGVCRLCWRQASTDRDATKGQRPYRPLDVVGANRHGQQLFFANMGRRRLPRHPPQRPYTAERTDRVPCKQLGLFDPQPETWASRRGLPEPARTDRTDALDAFVRDHAARHGWNATTTRRTRLALRVLLSRRPPGERIRASEVIQLRQVGLPATPLLTVLAAADMLDDDRVPAIVAWFERQIAGLPSGMADELRIWFDVLRRGSTTPPRSRPRAETTIRVRVRWALPVLRAWAADGHESLREIARADIVAILPGGGSPRATTGAALRSMFRTLKARKVIFIDPTARVPTGSAERRKPLPVDAEELRAAIHSVDPARAALAALVAFHGLRPEQLRALQLTDIRDGRLRLGHGTVLLAEPVRQRVAAWLDHRARRWPNTANPHLFVTTRSANRTNPVGRRWTNYTLGMAAKAVRVDRILDEARATGGDVRRLCDLFGLSVSAAIHYVERLDRPGILDTKPDASSRTEGST